MRWRRRRQRRRRHRGGIFRLRLSHRALPTDTKRNRTSRRRSLPTRTPRIKDRTGRRQTKQTTTLKLFRGEHSLGRPPANSIFWINRPNFFHWSIRRAWWSRVIKTGSVDRAAIERASRNTLFVCMYIESSKVYIEKFLKKHVRTTDFAFVPSKNFPRSSQKRFVKRK